MGISVEEIPVERIHEFWNLHYEYLINDEIITEDEDKEYFKSDQYRGFLKERMTRSIDKHHMVFFVRETIPIGATQYTIYQSEDGKCFILDFWVFPEFRGNGTGHKCFEALEKYTKMDGAKYYELNTESERQIRFWKSLGFIENGIDEYGIKLFVKRGKQ